MKQKVNNPTTAIEQKVQWTGVEKEEEERELKREKRDQNSKFQEQRLQSNCGSKRNKCELNSRCKTSCI